MRTIRQVTENRKDYLWLLLEADPDEPMIDRYLARGRMYVLEDDGEAVGVAVTVPYKDEAGACELKNIAVDPKRQKKGYGSELIRGVMEAESADYAVMYVGTTLPTEPFYRANGFEFDHLLKNFFIDNYPEPIFEDGVQAIDMRYLKRSIRA